MRRLLILVPVWAWLLAFVAAPAVILLGIALGQSTEGIPPFAPPVGPGLVWQGSLGNFATLFEDEFYFDSLLRALRIATSTAALALLLGFPMALAIARAPRARQALLLALVLLPFWTGFLLRMGAFIGLLRDQGLINGLLIGLGVVQEPLPLLYTEGAMLAGMLHAYLPFAVLPLYAALSRLDPVLEQAAMDLGATPGAAFRTVTLPLALPGIIAGFLLVFIPAAGEFVIPELLGPSEALPVGRVLWQEFFQNRDWPLAAALAVALLMLLILPIRLFQRLESKA
ncbi:ABC transporter permease [Plastoroseomonas hellenica]|uniref:ABC transporter permease n=1 Tax=Plastoroseomonas hellenica TaxID=2687306 RepID=UPI001BACD6FE|nr:ABC transporter permease [Plastoroseomonas hellenica]MBR0642410.1 ABC transporter permease [Plastoroseomonas hellenica]